MTERSTQLSEFRVPVGGGDLWVRLVGTAPECLILLSGGPGAPSDYMAPLEKLANRSRRVVRFDEFGTGKSPNLSLREPTVANFLADLETIRAYLNVDRWALLGHAWGGMLAVEYALEYPDRVGALVLYGMAASIRTASEAFLSLCQKLPPEYRAALLQQAGTADHAARALASQAMTEFNERFVCKLRPWPRELSDMAAALESSRTYEVMWGPDLFPSGSLVGWDRAKDLSRIQTPALVLAGREDAVTPECAEEVARLMPRAELHIFERSSHYAHFEEPVQFLRVVGEFLDRTTRFVL